MAVEWLFDLKVSVLKIYKMREYFEKGPWRQCFMSFNLREGKLYYSDKPDWNDLPLLLALAAKQLCFTRVVDQQGRQYDYFGGPKCRVVEPSEHWPLQDFLITKGNP